MNLFVVIVTYNASKYIEKTLHSIYSADLFPEIIIVDNASADNTLKIVEGNFDKVKIIKQTKNLGFGEANNIGIDYALKLSADYIMLLNQDAYWFKGSIKELLLKAETTDGMGLISPVHLEGSGDKLDFAFHEYISPRNTEMVADILLENKKYFYEVNFVNAAAWILKANVFKELGTFHPIFDHYGEDEEFCIRLKNHNKKVLVSPQHFIIHDRPQERTYNPYFSPEKKLRREMLINFFKLNNPLDDDDSRFVKLILISLITLKIKRAFLALKEYLLYKRQIKTLTK